MAINYAFSEMETLIESSCICADDYDISNLISHQNTKRSKGFRAENFILPPVIITIKFKQPVELHRMDICPGNSNQCIKVLKIFVDEKLKFKTDHTKVKPWEIPGFRKVATSVFNDINTVIVVNKSYAQLRDCSTIMSNIPESNYQHVVSMFGRFKEVHEIKLQICAMLQGSIPTLGSLDIWGKPSNSCPRKIQQDIIEKSRKCRILSGPNFPSFYGCSTKDDPELTTSTSRKPDNDKINETFKMDNDSGVPSEFTDPLTLEVMINPILLPSGNIIDQRTLDKHIRSQQEMGNLPSDPFTGILFTSEQKPMTNIALQQRISKFHDSKDSNKKYKKRTFDQITSKPAISVQSEVEHVEVSKNEKGFNHPVKYRKIELNGTKISLFCSECEVFLTSKLQYYKLPCNHHCCNNCVREISTCKQCKMKFSSKDIVRSHIQ